MNGCVERCLDRTFVFVRASEISQLARAAADVSIYLGLNDLLPRDVWVHYKKVSPSNYLKCCESLRILRNELTESGLEQADYVDVYHFMFFVYRKLKDMPGVLDELRKFSTPTRVNP